MEKEQKEQKFSYPNMLKFWDIQISKIITFPFGTNGKLMILSVSVLKHTIVHVVAISVRFSLGLLYVLN